MKLNQALAIRKTTLNQRQAELTKIYQMTNKTDLLSGVSRIYQPKDDEGERFPSEEKKVQITIENLLKQIAESEGICWDVTADVEYGNMLASADIVVNGTILATAVPATYLLYLEKKLTDIHTVVNNLPVLDAAETWILDTTSNLYVTSPVETSKTKKLPRVLVKSEATDKHPAQTEVFQEDVLVGYWKTIKQSGSIPQIRKSEILSRVRELQTAVKMAREQANSVEIQHVTPSKTLLDYILSTK